MTRVFPPKPPEFAQQQKARLRVPSISASPWTKLSRLSTSFGVRSLHISLKPSMSPEQRSNPSVPKGRDPGPCFNIFGWDFPVPPSNYPGFEQAAHLKCSGFNFIGGLSVRLTGKVVGAPFLGTQTPQKGAVFAYQDRIAPHKTPRRSHPALGEKPQLTLQATTVPKWQNRMLTSFSWKPTVAWRLAAGKVVLRCPQEKIKMSPVVIGSRKTQQGKYRPKILGNGSFQGWSQKMHFEEATHPKK